MMGALFARDMRLAFSRGNGLGVAILFFFCFIVVMSFSLGMMPNILSHVGAGIVWLGAILSMLLGFERLLLHDAEDGTLDILLLHNRFFGLCLLLFIKSVAHWLGSVVPVIMAAPLLGILMDMDFKENLAVFASLLVASPAITFVGLVAAALGIHLPRGSLLVAVIVLPLAIPVMIFAINGVEMVETQGIMSTPLLLLVALNLFLLPTCCIAAAAALKYK